MQLMKNTMLILAFSAALSTFARAGDATAPLPLSAVLTDVSPAPAFSPALFPDTAGRPQKSKVLGALYSAAIPGMGELYAGAYGAGRWFTAGEVLLWLGYAGMTLFGNAMIADASTYAGVHAGAQTGGKADQFLTDVGNFSNTGQYNDKKARDGDYRLIYTAPEYLWQWDNEVNRTTFRSMHLRANTLLDNTKYLVAAIVVNHLASAIDAVLQVNRVNRGISVGAAPTFENGSWGTVMNVRIAW